MKLNNIFWIALCGLIFSAQLYACQATKSEDSFTSHSIISLDTSDLTSRKIQHVEDMITVLTEESEAEGLNPLIKNQILNIIDNLESILVSVDIDREIAELRRDIDR